MDSVQESDLAPSFVDFSQSEKSSEIKPPLISSIYEKVWKYFRVVLIFHAYFMMDDYLFRGTNSHYVDSSCEI